MRTVLVTGGAGYVGSHSVLHFREVGWRTVVFDDLSTGHRELAALADRFIEGDLEDAEAVGAAVASEPFDGVLHCAAKSLVGESVAQPLLYFRANLGGAVNLLQAALDCGGVPIVFSSSAAVYGDPAEVPLTESAPTRPINPYGFTKLGIERALEACDVAHGLRSVSLRYFNAAGADVEGRAGERHEPETHLIPNLIRAGLTGQTFRLFGDDYPTPDGTCVRDYIDVGDLARAHRLALEHLWEGGGSAVLNLGSGDGFSVRQVLEAAETALGGPIRCEVVARRPGDPAVLVADHARAREVLGWVPERSRLETMLTTAVAWHRRESAGEGA